MDTSKRYIKMCEKAKELNYSPSGSDGNWYYYPEEDIVKCRNSYEGDFGDVWLPRQDQLQEMVRVATISIQQFEEEYSMDVWHTQYRTYEKEPDCEFVATSMEQLWLAFVMKEKYNNTWNGKNWKRNKST